MAGKQIKISLACYKIKQSNYTKVMVCKSHLYLTKCQKAFDKLKYLH